MSCMLAGKLTSHSPQAARLYQSVHQSEGARCGDLACYSTCLWYTQREVELSALAHEMLEANKGSPEVHVLFSGSPLALSQEGLLRLCAHRLEYFASSISSLRATIPGPHSCMQPRPNHMMSIIKG